MLGIHFGPFAPLESLTCVQCGRRDIFLQLCVQAFNFIASIWIQLVSQAAPYQFSQLGSSQKGTLEATCRQQKRESSMKFQQVCKSDNVDFIGNFHLQKTEQFVGKVITSESGGGGCHVRLAVYQSWMACTSSSDGGTVVLMHCTNSASDTEEPVRGAAANCCTTCISSHSHVSFSRGHPSSASVLSSNEKPGAM